MSGFSSRGINILAGSSYLIILFVYLINANFK